MLEEEAFYLILTKLASRNDFSVLRCKDDSTLSQTNATAVRHCISNSLKNCFGRIASVILNVDETAASKNCHRAYFGWVAKFFVKIAPGIFLSSLGDTKTIFPGVTLR